MIDSNSDFQFSPLPAPYPMKWDYLMPPVKRAVRDLLIRIDGAEKTRKELEHSDKDKKILGNCFLVHGSRGTGKTTVLLSAQDAIRKDSSFFEDTDYGREARINLQENALKEKVKQLCGKNQQGCRENQQGIFWLDILDVEPLPETTNLLTTVLTRVRDALDSSRRKDEGDALISIYEEGEESALQQLSHLINDATLMWEDIMDVDTREKASRQIKAADIYASFQERFKNAMDQLSKELGRRRGLCEDGCSIVLPIDNIDRSTEHLRSIVKLAQMVAHRRLWLVMAGDFVEVGAFLERVYWKELIRSQGGGDARGKMRGGEDETLFMARRQAITTSQRLWPSTHRIEIDLVKPKEALNFRPPDKDKAEILYDQLAKVVIPTTQKQRREGNQVEEGIHLIELFDIYDKVNQLFRPDDIKNASSLIKTLENSSNQTQEISDFILNKLHDKSKNKLVENLNRIIQKCDFREEDWFKGIESKLRSETRAKAKRRQKIMMPSLNRMILEDVYPEEIEASVPYLTSAAQHGLTLSARSLLDLWRLADWAVNTKSSLNFSAEKIARTMLRNAISGSDISSVMGQYLQNEIIHRSEDGGTYIFFGELELKQSHLRTPGVTIFQKPNINDKQSYCARSKLMVGTMEEVTLSLKREQPSRMYDTDYKSEKAGNFPQPFIIANEDEEQIVELPAPVAAWLSILYDILILAEPEIGSTVITSKFEPPQGIVEIGHDLIRKLKNYEKSSLKLSWPLPKLSTFWAYDVFRQQWRNFYKSKMDEFGYQNISEDLLLRLLAAGWTTCVLDTFLVFNPIPEFNQSVLKLCFEQETGEVEEKSKGDANKFMEIDGKVMEYAAILYSRIREMESTLPQQQAVDPQVDIQGITVDIQGLRVQMRDWLENKLPCFMSYLYVPVIPNEEGEVLKNRCKELLEYIERYIEQHKENAHPLKYNLVEYWKNNWPFILYDFETELLNNIPEDIKKWKKYQPSISEHQKCQEYLGSIRHFDDLHRLFDG